MGCTSSGINSYSGIEVDMEHGGRAGDGGGCSGPASPHSRAALDRVRGSERAGARSPDFSARVPRAESGSPTFCGRHRLDCGSFPRSPDAGCLQADPVWTGALLSASSRPSGAHGKSLREAFFCVRNRALLGHCGPYSARRDPGSLHPPFRSPLRPRRLPGRTSLREVPCGCSREMSLGDRPAARPGEGRKEGSCLSSSFKAQLPENLRNSRYIFVTCLLESSTRLKPHEAQNYRKKALWVSWFSIIVTLALAVAAFTVSVMRYSASAFGFAFDAILDVLSSAIVLWRYSNAAAVHSAHREYIACVILGVIFLLSSICIVVKAIHDLSTRLLPEVDDFLFSVSILSGILCSILAVLKFMLGKVLTSRALITDGFNSLVGSVMGFSILLSAEVFKHDSAVWYLDGSIGVLIGLTIFAYGVKLLIDMVPRVRQTRHYEMFE
ncbi:PREDICTED: transmembrane protein 163 [Rhinopithecus bieti]|nr:PREDICTED: transmembrane protein 163 [Rhinopithecus bieti]